MMKEQTRFSLSKNSQSSRELIKTPEILKNSFASHMLSPDNTVRACLALSWVSQELKDHICIYFVTIFCLAPKGIVVAHRKIPLLPSREMRHPQMTKQNYSITTVNTSHLASHLASQFPRTQQGLTWNIGAHGMPVEINSSAFMISKHGPSSNAK